MIYYTSNNKLKGLGKGGNYMQQMLQQLFERECRNYAFYKQKLNVIEGQYDELTKRRDEICQYGESCSKVNEIATLLKSKEFLKVKDKLDLPENFDTFKKSFSNHKLGKDYSGELKFIEKQQGCLIPFMKILRENLNKSKENLFKYIEMASENKVKFLFTKDNKTVREIFVLYYKDGFNFGHRRNVIEIRGCKLDKKFMNAYTSVDTRERRLEAQNWFTTMAEKYREF